MYRAWVAGVACTRAVSTEETLVIVMFNEPTNRAA
jgi:hypothetical protein